MFKLVQKISVRQMTESVKVISLISFILLIIAFSAFAIYFVPNFSVSWIFENFSFGKMKYAFIVIMSLPIILCAFFGFLIFGKVLNFLVGNKLVKTEVDSFSLSVFLIVFGVSIVSSPAILITRQLPSKIHFVECSESGCKEEIDYGEFNIRAEFPKGITEESSLNEILENQAISRKLIQEMKVTNEWKRSAPKLETLERDGFKVHYESKR